MRERADPQPRRRRAGGGLDLDAVLGRVRHGQPVGEGDLLDARLGAETPFELSQARGAPRAASAAASVACS